MSNPDFIREVEEDLRRDQLKALWDRFGPYILGVALLIVLGTAGYQGWQYWESTSAAKDGDRFRAAIVLAEEGNHDGAITALETIADTGWAGYPLLAGFRAASEKAAIGDIDGAITDFDALAANGSATTLMRDLANIRAALLAIDHGSREAVESRVRAMAEAGGPFQNSARELMGLAAWKAADYAATQRWFSEITGDTEAPQSMRARAEIMLSLVRGETATDATGESQS